MLDVFEDPAATLPLPAKIFLIDELQPQNYGFPVMKSPALDDLDAKLERWMDEEIAARLSGASATKSKADEHFRAYRATIVRIAQNALHSSILADYHAVFRLVHSQTAARLFTGAPRKIVSTASGAARQQTDTLKYLLFARWAEGIREALPEIAGAGVAQGSGARTSSVMTCASCPADEERPAVPFQTTRARIANDCTTLSSANESLASSPGSSSSLWRMRNPVAESCTMEKRTLLKTPSICRRGM